MKKIVLSPQQQEIVDFIPTLLSDKTINSISIKAFAGCGKSFILKYIANRYINKKFLGLAFNSSIVSENKKEFPKRNSKWFTLHGFAREYLKKMGVNIDFKNARAEYKPLELIEILKFKDTGQFQLAENIKNVMKVFCQSSLKNITEDGIIKAAKGQKNSEVLGINKRALPVVCEYVRKLWAMFEKNEIAPTFDFYLKYFEIKRFAEKITEFDFIELDEAQDSNAVTMSIIFQMNAKKIFVGDEHQSIYGFRGTINALNYADKLFYLSTTYRYIPEIANFANEILKGYKLEKVSIQSNTKKKTVKEPTKAFLSRNNSSMISLIDEFITADKEFTTVKDPKELFAAAIAILEIRLEKKTKQKGYGYLNQFKEIEEIKDYIEETGDREIQSAFKMQQRYGKKLYRLQTQAQKYYKQKKKNFQYILSTAHTSKGLEWDSVKLLQDFPDIQKMLKDEKINSPQELMKRYKENNYKANEIIQEINLWYVAVTRARYEVE